MRTPASLLLIAIYGCAMLAAALLFAALRMPATGVAFTERDHAIALGVGDRTAAVLARDTPVTFRSRAGVVAQPAGAMVADFSPDGRPADIAGWFAQRDAILRILAAGDARLELPGAAPIALRLRPRTLGDIPRDSWLLLAQAAIFTLLGTWLFALRPADRGARLFALSCGAIVVASLSGALFDARELTAGGALLHACQIVNFAASYVSSAALIALFLCQPRRLASGRFAAALVAAAFGWGLACGIGWLPLRAFYLGLAALTLGFLGVLVAQWRATRGDPVARAALRWVGLATFAGSAQIVAAMAIPQLFGLPSFAGDGMTIVPLTLVYGGIAFGIGPGRLFDLDLWTYRVMLGAVAALGFLALDAALVGIVRLDGPVAIGVTLLVIGYLYLPLRGFVWRRIAGGGRMSDSEKLQLATEVAFAATPAARREGWRRLLARLFDPLAIAAADDRVADVAIARDGADLLVPEIADDVALRLSFRDAGRRLFGQEQLRMGREMVALMHRAEIARAEYLRGVGEERQRIARDLHDDVCAVLVTGLQRDDPQRIRGDIRTAMADIRTMISGLTGERIELDQALADLRFETAERLAAAGIALDWPFAAVAPDNRLLDYPVYRNLLSAHREAITNILKHASATRVSVSVRSDGGELLIVVADDGRAATATAPDPRGGHGIGNMRARLAEIGGRFGFSAGEGGARVDIAIPLA